jgi:hypothetical protein
MQLKLAPYLLIFVLLAPLTLFAETTDDAFSVNRDMVFNHLVGNYQSMVLSAGIPIEVRKGVAQELYGLIFACWLDRDYRGIAQT